MNELAILGAGSWGTALAVVLAPNFDHVRLWARNPDLASQMQSSRENSRYLGGIVLPENVFVTAHGAECLGNAPLVLIAVPSQFFREVLTNFCQAIAPGAIVVSATKGLEPNTLLRMSEVACSAADIATSRMLALSGPSFAREAAELAPTALVIAGDAANTRIVQSAFVRPSFRVYTSEDILGVEIGGALKNVVAIGAGIITGLGLGHNAVAALITRGLAEMTRLAVAMGAEARTLSGLAGLGDLVLTCTGDYSRNRTLGIRLSQQATAIQVLTGTTMTTEGVRTATVAVQLADRFGVDLPIAMEMSAVLSSGRSPYDAVRRLMERASKQE